MAGFFMPSLRVMVRDCAWAGYGCAAACVPLRESYQHSCKRFAVRGMQQSQGMEALQMLIGGFAIFMIPQVVGSVVVLLELAAVMLRQVWYI